MIPRRLRHQSRSVVRGVDAVWPLAAQAWLAWRACRHWRALPELRTLPAERTGKPEVACVVPARDEAANLRRLLPSLRRSGLPFAEMVVVDDGSSDGTAAVAAALGARVVAAGPLPAGWTGKCHACQVGADATVAPWLLFADADTWHAPGALGAALDHAQRHRLDAVSVFPAQVFPSAVVAALVTSQFRHYFAGFRPRAWPTSSGQPTVNGQYLLIRRSAYRRTGGHAAVRGSVVEDVALANALDRAGCRLGVARAGRLVRVRMYARPGAVWAGFRKNAARFLGFDPRAGALVALSVALAVDAPRRALAAARAGQPALAAAHLAAPHLAALAWAVVAGAPGGTAPAAVASALFGQLVALAGLWDALVRRRTLWKGRVYRNADGEAGG